MPVYEYDHIDACGPGCKPTFEHIHGIHDRLTHCPVCNAAVLKVVSRFSHHADVLATSNIKEKGFRRFRRKDKGVYEED